MPGSVSNRHMEDLTFLIWLLPTLIVIGLLSAWAGPRLFPVAARIKLRAAHVVVMISAVLAPAALVAAGEVIPGLSLAKLPNAIGILVMVAIGSAVVSAIGVQIAESCARESSSEAQTDRVCGSHR